MRNRYFITVVIISVATALQLWLWPYLLTTPFLLYYPAVIVCALVGDGLSAIVLSSILAQYLFFEPKYSLSVSWPNDYLRQGIFLLAAFMIRQITTSLSRALETSRQQRRGLERSEKWLATTLTSIGDAVVATDTQGRVTLLNTVAEDLTEWSISEARGRPLSEVFHIVDQKTKEVAENPVEKVLAEGRIVGLANHTMLIGRRGKESIIEDSAAPIKLADGDGETLGVVLVFRDVTEKYTREQKLAAALEDIKYNRERMQRLLDNALDAVVEMDDEGIITHWNRQAERVFGFSKDEAIGSRLSSLIIPPEYREAHEKGMRHFQKTGEGPVLGRRIEITGLRKNGEIFPIELNISPVKMADRTLFAAFVRDISEAQRLQRELVLKSDALENSLNGFDIVDEDGKFVYANRAYLEMWGYDSLDEIIGTTPVSHCVDPTIAKKIIDTLKDEGKCDIEFLARRKDGSTFDVRMLARMAYDADGKEVYPTTSIDITDLKAARKEEKLAKEAAEKANRAKSHFLANMSHEIRTPIGVIQGFAEVLSESANLTSEQQKWLETICRNTRLLTNVIGEILDLSRIEAEMLEIQPQRVQLQEVIDDLSASFGTTAKDKGIELKFEFGSDTPKCLFIDPTRFRQVLFNLVGNAVKFTDRGSVQVSFHSQLKEKDRLIRIVVSDSGIGMSPEQQAKIFQPFMQADSSTTRKYGGTGLGLVIAKRLSKALNGDLQLLKSEPGKGTSFEFSFSYLEDDALTAGTADRLADNRGMGIDMQQKLRGKVLLVEDSTDNQLLIQNYLAASGLQLDLASSGQQALAMVQNKSYDLILLDIQMPLMDGYETLAKLRQMGVKAPVVALTAHALLEEKRHALAAGFSDYLTKPIAKKTLFGKLQEYLS